MKIMNENKTDNEVPKSRCSQGSGTCTKMTGTETIKKENPILS